MSSFRFSFEARIIEPFQELLDTSEHFRSTGERTSKLEYRLV